MALDDLTGRTFGDWFVVDLAARTERGEIKWLCLCTCGKQEKVFAQGLRSGRSTRCRECRYKDWNKGGSITPRGYRVLYVKDHPRGGSKGQVFEHVLIMEETLGRYLLSGETVHHKNGVKHDNDPDNLELWVSHQPSGQRPEDLVAWANEILDRYGDK